MFSQNDCGFISKNMSEVPVDYSEDLNNSFYFPQKELGWVNNDRLFIFVVNSPQNLLLVDRRKGSMMLKLVSVW